MTQSTSTRTRARILAANEGERSPERGVTDRFMIDSAETEGRFSLVQHLFQPRALAAPLHRLADVDEYTYVLTGQIGAIVDGEEFLAGPGDLIFKPRNHWHTFWNAGDEPATCLEIISAGGLEELFRELARLEGDPEPETLAVMAAAYGCEIDFEATMPVVERHRLVF